MGESYFTAENALKHLFFITGSTSDEFYTDSGLKLNIEQLMYLELKRNGYERIVFYDEGDKLYCYDDESYALLTASRMPNANVAPNTEPLESSSIRRNSGLRRGKHAHSVSNTNKQSASRENETTNVEQSSKDVNQKWIAGEKSKILIRNIVHHKLHLGMQSPIFVKRQIDAYICNPNIKTAVVINDANAFLSEFGMDPIHTFTAGYERLSSDNHNIIVFIYTDPHLSNIYQVNQFKGQENYDTLINITCPNAAELRNMLIYFKVNHGLKIRVSELPELATALKRAMTLSPGYIRMKELAERLTAFGTDKLLTVDACYELLKVEKPNSARKQLEDLIGMQKVKDALSQYNVNDNSQSSLFKYLTASRLQMNRDIPNVNNEMIHFVLTGNPGTGKTTIAKLIGQIFFEMGYLENGHVVETDRSELVGSHVGETAIFTRRKVEEAMGGVLFIDEAYSLKRQKDTGNDFGQEAIDTLCKLMDQYKGKFIVVAAGYPREMQTFLESNSGLASRFTKLHIDDYLPSEMCKILSFHAKRRNAIFSDELNSQLPNFCENWVNLADENWGNAREAVNLINAMMRAWKNDPEKKSKVSEDGKQYAILTANYIPDNQKEYLRPVSEMRAEVLQRLDQMTGLQSVKDTVRKLRLRMLAGDMTEPGHYIFTGNPGTGKTTVARYMGQILRNLGMLKRGHVIEYTASQLMSVVFDSDHSGNFDEVAEKALDGILFIDEAHQLVLDITGRGGAIIRALVPFMEKHRENLCVIAAGYEDGMDDFLKLDPGFQNRFNAIINFENYTGDQLRDILLRMLEEKGIFADDDYREYALRALTRYVKIHGRDKDFGNARYLRSTFLPASLDAQNMRLIQTYGEDFPRELKKTLTGADIPADLVRFTKTPLEKPDNRSAMEKIDSLIGYKEIKTELKKLLKTAEFNKKNEIGVSGMPERLHWILEGNPGTGKTTIARLIGEVYKECGILQNGRTYKVTRSDLVEEHVGGSAKRTRQWIEKAMGGVLFIDEAYSLTPPEGDPFGKEVIAELVEAMETRNGEFAVVCAGYPEDMDDFLKVNAGLSSRMKKFVLEDYSPEELSKIFLLKCEKENTLVDVELKSKLEVFFMNKKRRVSKAVDWGNGREAENLLREMLHKWMDNPTYTDDTQGTKKRLLTVKHIPDGQQRFLKGKMPEKNIDASAIDDIEKLIGFDDIKAKLKDLLLLKKTATESGREDLLDDVNLHWVLRGNPGTGKTTIAKLIGKVYKEMGLLAHGRTVKVTRSDLVAGYVGQTAIKTQKCIDRAIGGVLFIDEAYSLKRADDFGNDFGQEAIDTLLEQMSARNGEFSVIVAGYPKEMEVFLNSNPGFVSRFDDDFLIKDYTADELLQIFEIKCRKKKFYLDDDMRDLIRKLFENMIASKMKNWANGREAENLEKHMRRLWVKNPVNRIDEVSGEKLSYYTQAHIPEKYKSFLIKEDALESKECIEESLSNKKMM